MAALVLAACSTPTQPEIKLPQVTLTLQSGEIVVGAIQSENDEAIEITTDKGIYRRIPAKEVLFVKLADQPGDTPSAPPVLTNPAEFGTLEKFQPPASGVLTIPAGEMVSINPSETIDGETMFAHQVLTGKVTVDIPAHPIGIPGGANASLELMEITPHDISTIVFGLSGVNINGHLYKVRGSANRNVIVRLGSARAAGLTRTAKIKTEGEGPRPRISNGTVLSWKLAQPIVLKEVK